MSLFSRLFLVNALSILATLGAVFFIVRKKAASYFMALADKYGIEPAELHEMFLQALNYGFFIAGLFSVTVACVTIWWLVRRFIKPVGELSRQFEEISAGSFSVRAAAQNTPELAQLAQSFNRMANELEKQEILRQRLIVDVAHELKTPLTNLRGTLEGVEDGLITNNQETTRSLIFEADRLGKLVNEILDLARLEANREKIQLTQADLKEILRDSFRLFGERLMRKNIRCTIRDWPQSVPLECDKEKLQRVFENLWSNIERYAPEGDCIECEFETCGSSLKVKLSNAAPSLIQQDIDNLFERFYRCDLSRNSQGSGLGLSIVKQIVELHGGEVGADFDDNRLRIWFQIPAKNMQLTMT